MTAALVGAALVLGTVISAWQAVRATNAEDDAKQGWAGEKIERERAVEGERIAKQRLFDARLAQARAGRRAASSASGSTSLKAITEAVGLAKELGLAKSAWSDLRHEAIACLGLTDLHLDKEWRGWSAEFGDWPAFDAELRHCTRSDMHGNVTVHPVGEMRELARVGDPAPGSYHRVAFSPSGDLLVLVSQTVTVWDWRRQSVVWRWPHKDFVYKAVAFHPNNRQIAIGRAGGTVAIFDLHSKEVQQIKLEARPYRLAFSPDGKKLAVACYFSKQVQIHDLETGQLLRQWDEPAGPWGVAWHPDGQLLAVWTNDFHIHLWNAADRRGTGHSCADTSRRSSRPGFLPSGDRLWSWSWDGTTRLWDPLERSRAGSRLRHQCPLEPGWAKAAHAGAATNCCCGTWSAAKNTARCRAGKSRAISTNTRIKAGTSARTVASWPSAGPRRSDSWIWLQGAQSLSFPRDPAEPVSTPRGANFSPFANNIYRWPLQAPSPHLLQRGG